MTQPLKSFITEDSLDFALRHVTDFYDTDFFPRAEEFVALAHSWKEVKAHILGIDYRHLVSSLVRKPGAFRRYVYREALFPTLMFRRTYDVLAARSEKWADLEYVRILHLAATTMQCKVEAALDELLEAGEVPEYEIVKARVQPALPQSAPAIRARRPDLAAYDALLTGQGIGT